MSRKTLNTAVAVLGDQDLLRAIGREVMKRMAWAFLVGVAVGVIVGLLL